MRLKDVRLVDIYTYADSVAFTENKETELIIAAQLEISI